MTKQNYSRSNVNERTLSISAPDRSSFDMSHSVRTAFKLGVLHPVNLEYLTPTDMLSGKMSPNLQLEKITTPEMGRLRLDTHSFVVAARRINKDWRQFAESSRDFANLQKKPNFSIEQLFAKLIITLLHDPDVTTSYSLSSALSALDDAFDTTDEDFDLNTACITMIENAIDNYKQVFNDSTDFGYTKDFCVIEIARLTEFLANNSGIVNIGLVIRTVLEPYFGLGSILDMIGYPIFRQYSALDNMISNQSLYDTWDDADAKEYVDKVLSTKLDELLLVYSGQYTGESPFDLHDSYAAFDEMPIRAIYAAWYDYLRNWHVEKRTNVLDPDNFGETSLIARYISNYQQPFVATLQYAVQLLVPRFRMFNRDGLTTVQEDDVYRHVYTPIYDVADGSVTYAEKDADADDVVQKALSIVLDNGSGLGDGVSVPFMGDLFNRHVGVNTNTISSYMLDLQTMKRTGMLEKFLARDFYNPDTYAGFIRARYSIEPADIEFLSSVYVGGDEKMFDGEQQISNVATDVMPAGQRTFTGGVALSDGISYRVTDFAYLVSFVSLMPMPEYDVANMHAHELTPFDLPLPEFASDTRVSIRTSDMIRGVKVEDEPILGFVPRYYGYRARLDEVHDVYLTDKRIWTWVRDWYTMNYESLLRQTLVSGQLPFALNAYSLRVHIPVDNFLNLKQWDRIAYGKVDIQMSIDRPLPAAVEFI